MVEGLADYLEQELKERVEVGKRNSEAAHLLCFPF